MPKSNKTPSIDENFVLPSVTLMSSLPQSLKQLPPIVVRPLGRVMEVREVQPLKQPSFKILTVEGRLMEVREVQFWKQ